MWMTLTLLGLVSSERQSKRDPQRILEQAKER
jgi:hypothetical protein